MRKKAILSLLLACVLLTGTVSAAWSPVDFSGGSLSGIVATENGSLLVSDVFNKVVWRVHADGSVEQAVGQISIPGLDGEPIGKYDDGTLDTALFMEPWAMAPFLKDGYAISDSAAHVVRWFNDEGVYTAVGSGKPGNQNGTGTKAQFNRPTGLATGDDGQVYIADTGNGSIRVMNEKGQVSTLVTGLVEPTGLCWHDGALYVAETGRNCILRIEDGKREVIAGGGEEEADGHYPGAYADGPVSSARFDHPQGVAVGEDGTIYVADTGNHAVRKIAEGYVTTLAVSRETPQAPIQPRGILVRGNTLLVTDLLAQTLLTIDLNPTAYTDVPTDMWCYEAVMAATERGITGGTGNGLFSPNAPVTRATFAVMLSRLHLHADGNAVIDGEASFTDVPKDAWYASAVRWAAEQGIVSGYGDGLFGPDDPITREQLSVMLWRYAQAAGINVSVGEDTNILSYTDAFDISEYAIPAMQWACGAGVMDSYADGSLKPYGQATRAQAVQMLMNVPWSSPLY